MCLVARIHLKSNTQFFLLNTKQPSGLPICRPSVMTFIIEGYHYGNVNTLHVKCLDTLDWISIFHCLKTF